MPYPNISDIRFASVKNQLYFLDTNIWLALVSEFQGADAKNSSVYISFVEKIIASQLNPKPKILLCNLQVSELINAYLRQIAMKRYLLEKNLGAQGADYYKMSYRQTEHFETHHKLIRDEIKNYSPFLETHDDMYNAIGPYKVIDEVSTKMDYNDYYYYKLCLEIKNTGKLISIVTHDQDFKFRDVEIITNNNTLKNLRY